jgi:hypothetical protein
VSAELYIADDGTCLLGDQPLHPPRGAFQAAAAELSKILSSARPQDTLVLAGSGLGWHAKAASLKPQGPRIVIYETDTRRVAMARSLGPELAYTNIVTNDADLTELLAQRLVYGQDEGKPGRVAVYTPEAYRTAEPNLGDQARKIVRQVLSRSNINHQTKALNQAEWLDNLSTNFKQILQCPDLTRIANVFEGIPALVMGAGPSLDGSLSGLADFAGRALIMGAASVIGPMATIEMAPDVAVAIEAKDESRQFENADMGRTWLAAATNGHENHFEEWPGKKALFHLQPWAAKLSGGGLGLPNGGHATSAAFSLAILWGCDPIILVGQDLAYSSGRIHAANRPGGEDEQRPDMLEVPAIGGGLVKTSAVFMSYINWYQETAAYLARRAKKPRVINATAEGAYLDGFEHMLLGDALKLLTTLNAQMPDINSSFAKVPLPDASQVVQNLTGARVEVRRCMSELERGGIEAARLAAAKDSAAYAALELVSPEAESEEAAQKLQEMSQILRSMAEGMYA